MAFLTHDKGVICVFLTLLGAVCFLLYHDGKLDAARAAYCAHEYAVPGLCERQGNQ